jgi:hypothetical protein
MTTMQLPRSSATTTSSQFLLPVAAVTATVITSLLIRHTVSSSSNGSINNSGKSRRAVPDTNIYYYCYKYRSTIHRLKDGSLYIGAMMIVTPQEDDSSSSSSGNHNNKVPHGQGIKLYRQHKNTDHSDESDLHGKFKYSFEGTFEQGKPIYGVYTYTDGTQMEGPVVRGKIHGQGRMTLPDGSYYEGPFQYNTMFGDNGKFVYNNGREVSGHFVDGVLQGNGTVKTSHGDIAEGEWSEGKPTGKKMIVRYADGSVYEGEIKEDIENQVYLKHGTGVWQTPYDTRLKGSWKDDIAHGSFVILQSNGTCLKSDFWEGMECGKMVFTSTEDYL